MKIHNCSALYCGVLLPLIIMQTGCHNALGFSTATKFGLDISQRADQMVEVTMGYDRTEIASIPAPKDDSSANAMEATGAPDAECAGSNSCDDTYSVLGTFEVDYGVPFPFKLKPDPLTIKQFFATGMAARVAATKPELQRILGGKAGDYAAKSASEQAENDKSMPTPPVGEKQ